MMLHLGADVLIPTRRVVAILHVDPGARPPVPASGDLVVHITKGPYRAAVLTQDRSRITWYFTPISPQTLSLRAGRGLKGLQAADFNQSIAR